MVSTFTEEEKIFSLCHDHGHNQNKDRINSVYKQIIPSVWSDQPT